MPKVSLSLSDIYNKLCKECQDQVVAMVKDKMTDQAIRDQLELPKHMPEKRGK